MRVDNGHYWYTRCRMGLVTFLFFGLLFYRSRLTKKESDWIPLSDDAKEEKAIEAQKVIETKTHKLDFPIHAGDSLGDYDFGR